MADDGNQNNVNNEPEEGAGGDDEDQQQDDPLQGGAPPQVPAPAAGAAAAAATGALTQAQQNLIAQIVATAIVQHQQQQQANPTNPNAVFALTPARITTGCLDFNNKRDSAIFDTNSKELPHKYDGTSKNFTVLTEDLSSRATNANWNEILNIPENCRSDVRNAQGIFPLDLTVAAASPKLDLLVAFGSITEQQIRDHAELYMSRNDRRAQNALMMANTINASLTVSGKREFLDKKDKCMVNGMEHGPLLFKIIASRIIVDTQATDTAARDNLAALGEYMKTCKGDIKQFNKYVKEQRDILLGRGTDSSDLIPHLLRGYKKCTYAPFVTYMTTVEDRYNDRSQEHTATQIMDLALNYYDSKKTLKQWGSPDESQKTVLALQAELSKLRLKQSTKAKAERAGRAASGDDANTSGRRRGPNKKEEYAWKYEGRPTGKQSKTKMKDGKKFHWCPHHNDNKGMWVRHELSKCKNKPKPDDAEEKEESSSNDDEVSELQAKLSLVQPFLDLLEAQK